MILIGSQALALFEGKGVDDNKDYDIVCTKKEADELKNDGSIRLDIHKFDFLNNHHIERRFDSGHRIIILGHEVKICSPRGLAAIKRSHLWRDHAFDKHITIFHKHLWRHHHQEDESFIEERSKLTKKAFPQRVPSLMKSNDDFFDDAVKKIYDHDYLHELVAYGNAPIYTKLKHDQSKAWCERDLWDKLSHEDKIHCVAEETYVISIERFMVRNNWKYPAKKAYFQALKKVCTTLTSGWFRAYAINHYPEIVLSFDQAKYDKVKRILEEKDVTC